MAQVTALQPYGVPGRTRSFVAKAAAAVVLVNIIGSSAIVAPNHISDLGKNLLVEGAFETKEGAYVGGLSNYTKFDANGNQTFAGSAGFYPRFLTQATEPAAGTGATQCDTSEIVIWKDSDDNTVYLCFNDGGTVKTAELT